MGKVKVKELEVEVIGEEGPGPVISTSPSSSLILKGRQLSLLLLLHPVICAEGSNFFSSAVNDSSTSPLPSRVPICQPDKGGFACQWPPFFPFTIFCFFHTGFDPLF